MEVINECNSRIFIAVEGSKFSNPDNINSVVRFSKNDLLEHEFNFPYSISPLYSAANEGANLPNYVGDKFIAFIFVTKPFPVFSKIFKKFGENNFWFSLGLANLVFIENDYKIFTSLIQHLEENKLDYTGYEVWKLKDNKIIDIEHQLFSDHQYKRSDSEIIINDAELDLDIKFVITEYHLAKTDFLSKSKKYTHTHFRRHLMLFKVLDKIIIEFVNNLNSNSLETEELSNELGRVIQLNSSLSYVEHQGYSGIIPILDNRGIIKRHSLLGVGSGVLALYELMLQLEDSFLNLSISSNKDNFYINLSKSEASSYFKNLDIEHHFHSTWEKKSEFIIEKNSNYVAQQEDDLIFNRLAYFSGRLGFKEYEFCATSALQVLVAGSTIKWNILNYTHEILHNHVRIILDRFIYPTDKEQEKWFDSLLSNIEISFKPNTLESKDFTFFEYIQVCIYRYILNVRYYGSLSRVAIDNKVLLHTNPNSYNLPKDIDELYEGTKSEYRNISEIIVHILDYKYIYNDIDVYMETIWSSWAEVPSVYEEINNYIIRSLLVYSTIDTDGLPYERFEKTLIKFKAKMQTIFKINSSIYSKVNDSITKNKSDLKDRFTNCLLISDLAVTFFYTKVNFNEKAHFIKNEEPLNTEYQFDFEYPEFYDEEVKSKISLGLSELIKKVKQMQTTGMSNEQIERETAWLLVTLSSQSNYNA